jgi:hypothetical protein
MGLGLSSQRLKPPPKTEPPCPPDCRISSYQLSPKGLPSGKNCSLIESPNNFTQGYDVNFSVWGTCDANKNINFYDRAIYMRSDVLVIRRHWQDKLCLWQRQIYNSR